MTELNLRQLRVFEAAAVAASHADAAETLGLSQPAVSMHLRQLEAELKVALFSGRGRTRRLTDEGTELLRHARNILAQVQAAELALAARQGSTRGQLHLGVVPTANYFAPVLMMAFRERYPDVTLRLTVDGRDAILDMLHEHRIDLAIGGYPPSEADIEAEAFARHPHCIVAATGHPLTRRRRLQWSDLANEPFIFREPGSATRQFLEHLLTSQSLRMKIGIELTGNDTVRQAVMAGMGLTFMSAHVFQTELAAGLVSILDLQGMPKELDWCVLHRRDSVLSGVTASFREFVIERGAALIACKATV
jgi:LysR family transcriptional regulator, low CO2-responsive transcriptional regulator